MPSWSSTTIERNPSAWLSATLSVETTSSLGAPSGGCASQAWRSGSMRWQKPQLGRQKSTSVGRPRKSARWTVCPARSGKPKSGAGSPILGPTGGVAPPWLAAHCPGPQPSAAGGDGGGQRGGDQRPDGLCPLGQRTANAAIGTHEHCARGAMCLIGLSHFAVLLE